MRMYDIKPIATQYKGYRFRSRLEARWAVFFDALGIEWQYEAEFYDLGAAGGYIPDFWFPKHKAWAEVKPTNLGFSELMKCFALAYGTNNDVILLVGQPECKCYSMITNCGSEAVHAIWMAEIESGISKDLLTYAYKDSAIIIEDFVAITAKLCPITGFFETGSTDLRSDGIWGCDEDLALIASRSARFEHGQRPGVNS